jgi:Tfp pilus assembly PilM family ATPase
LKNELATRIGYWDSKVNDKERSIEKVILCGGIANLAGLPEYFTEALCLPAVKADVWQNAFRTSTVIPPITRRYSYGYATAVGLALGSFVKNL